VTSHVSYYIQPRSG